MQLQVYLEGQGDLVSRLFSRRFNLRVRLRVQGVRLRVYGVRGGLTNVLKRNGPHIIHPRINLLTKSPDGLRKVSAIASLYSNSNSRAVLWLSKHVKLKATPSNS